MLCMRLVNVTYCYVYRRFVRWSHYASLEFIYYLWQQ